MYAIVTGASSGIGKAIALMLAKEGYSIATLSRDTGRLEKLRSELHQVGTHRDHLLLKGNLLNIEDLNIFYQTLHVQKGIPDIIINNAGVYTEGLPSTLDENLIQEQFAINFMAAFRITQPWIAQMKARKSGTIVSIGSVVSKQPRTTAAAYSLSKQMLDNWMHLLADELRESDIRVCRIHPGSVNTNSWNDEPDEIRAAILDPNELAGAVKLAISLPADTWLEELVIRPLKKDI